MLKNKINYCFDIINLLKNNIMKAFTNKEIENMCLIILWFLGFIVMLYLLVFKEITPVAILLSAFMASVAMIKSINENKKLNKQKLEQEELQANDFFLFQVFIFYKIFINKKITANELLKAITEFHASINNEKIIFNLNKNTIDIFFNLIKETSKLKDEINKSILKNSTNENNIFKIRDYFNKVIHQSISSIQKEYFSIYGDKLSSNHLFMSEEYGKTIF